MNYYKESVLLEIVEDILDLDPAIRFGAIIDIRGDILEAIMKKSKTSLESQKQQEKFCKDAAKTRLVREKYDDSLGKVRYVHVERENVTQISVFPKNCTVFVTMEPELTTRKKLAIITKIKKMTSHM
tara:strand:+ start:963 stop:1343 length:381 start_codon:yes stop_codon:yes gene_type:complete